MKTGGDFYTQVVFIITYFNIKLQQKIVFKNNLKGR